MALALSKPNYSSPEKSEYFRGKIFMMAGSSPNHDRIARNIFAELNTIQTLEKRNAKTN
ncbi:MAG TPA: Uma2 family endonuclease [Caldilineaceae bacterium]|nr:Uma2 family endonuclease [Caldilineaceae bacterium]